MQHENVLVQRFNNDCINVVEISWGSAPKSIPNQSNLEQDRKQYFS